MFLRPVVVLWCCGGDEGGCDELWEKARVGVVMVVVEAVVVLWC